MFLSVVYLRECRRQPKQYCVFGETKSRSATMNWSGSGSGYCGGWKETNELDDINQFVWDVVVSNLSGSLRFELIVEQDCESILLKVEAWLLRLTLNSGWTEEILLESVGNFANSLLRFHCRYVDLLSVTVKSFSLICLR